MARAIRWMIALGFCPLMAQPLPSNAKIVVSGSFVDGPVGGDLEGCKQAATTPADIRRRFAHYHRISLQQQHDLYDFVDCGMQGTVSVRGRRYEWKLYLTDILKTTYPEGKPHLLAGKPDLSDRR